MKKLSKSVVCLIVCVAMVLPVAIFSACGGSELKYSASILDDATVGIAYTMSIANAECDDESADITYAIKSGSSLPVGLLLQDGIITGTPRAKTDSATFIVVASAEGYSDAEAEFSIKITQGTIAYTGSSGLQAANGRANEISIATATGAAIINYEVKDGDALPSGLSLGSDGKITGTPTTLGETKTFSVIASATDCTSAEAQFTIEVVLPWLEYSGSTLSNGRVAEPYSALISTSTGAGNNTVTYVLHQDSSLPTGLTLLSSGLISGTPSLQISRYKFTVVASSTGYTSAEAEFTLTILPASTGEVPIGTITYNTKSLPDGYVAEEYLDGKALVSVGTASADNRQTVSYSLKTEGTLPEGFSLLADGIITGTATATGTKTFAVTASAAGCESVDVEFSINISNARIIFSSKTLGADSASLATVGDSYSYSIADATVKDGGTPAITYTVVDASKMPVGLTLTSAGLIAGTPTSIGKSVRFSVEASASGYTTATADVYITIQDRIHTGVTRFEAEYWDLTGLLGGGYSGSAKEEGMIDSDTGGYGASNGYYVTFTHTSLVFNVPITSSAAATGVSFYIGLDTEIGDITLNNSVFDIRIGGKSVSYSIELTSAGTSSTSFGQFRRFTVSTNVSLAAGVNNVELEVLANTLLDGRTGGPGIDYIEFGNLGSASLSWRPKTINVL